MNTLELSKKIVLLGERKDVLERMKNDVSDYYTKEVSIGAIVEGTKYNKEYKGEGVTVDKQLFTNFLHDEIERLNNEIKGLIIKLQGGIN